MFERLLLLELVLELPNLIELAIQRALRFGQLVLEGDEGGGLLTVRRSEGGLGFGGRQAELRGNELRGRTIVRGWLKRIRYNFMTA